MGWSGILDGGRNTCAPAIGWLFRLFVTVPIKVPGGVGGCVNVTLAFPAALPMVTTPVRGSKNALLGSKNTNTEPSPCPEVRPEKVIQGAVAVAVHAQLLCVATRMVAESPNWEGVVVDGVRV